MFNVIALVIVFVIGFFIGRWSQMIFVAIDVHNSRNGDPEHIKHIEHYDKFGAMLEEWGTKSE